MTDTTQLDPIDITGYLRMWEQIKQLAEPHDGWPGRDVYQYGSIRSLGKTPANCRKALDLMKVEAAIHGWEVEVLGEQVYLVGPYPDPVTQVTTVTVRRERAMTLDGAKLRLILQAAGTPIPDDAAILVPVPGGGDWSNCELDLDCDTTIQVTWTEEVTST